MPSRAFTRWLPVARRAWDEIESAHAAVGGKGPGRRYATQQINQAYAVLICSHFQRYCRELHAEAADQLVAPITLPDLKSIARNRLTDKRLLDRGNASVDNLKEDFGRFGLKLWDEVLAQSARSHHRREEMIRLNHWRNAIAHQDFSHPQLGGSSQLRLSQVRVWRSISEALALSFDRVLRSHLTKILGVIPWP